MFKFQNVEVHAAEFSVSLETDTLWAVQTVFTCSEDIEEYSEYSECCTCNSFDNEVQIY